MKYYVFRKLQLRAILFGLTPLILTPLFAQKVNSDSIKTHRVKEVIVTAKRLQKEIIPVQQMTGKELEKLSAHSVADAIRYFSGVQIKDYGGVGGLKTANIRSMGTNHVGVFYDGVDLGNAQNGQIDLGRFSLENMEAITLYNGQKSSIFQPAKDYGSSGSIYLTSKTPSFTNNKTNNLYLTLKGGSFGTVNPAILFEHQFNKNLTASISAEYMYTNGQYSFRTKKENGYDTTEVRKNGHVSALRYEMGLYKNLEAGFWKVKGYLYNSNRGYPGASVREKPGEYTHQDKQWDTSVFLQSSLKKSFGDKYSLLLNSKGAYDYLHYISDPRLDVTTMYVNNTYKQKELYASISNLYTIFPCWDINLSADIQWNKLDANLVDFVYPYRITNLIALASSLDFNKFKVQASILGTFVSDKITAREESGAAGNKTKITPTLIASFKPWNKYDINFRAFYKDIFRMPTFNDLYYEFIGNKKLQPEYTKQYNIGVTYNKKLKDHWLTNIEVQVDGYYNEVTNKIVAAPTSNCFRWTMINLGKVEIRGVDIAAQANWCLNKDWQLSSRVTYTYQKAQDYSDAKKSYYKGQIPYTPWNSGTLILNGAYKSWELNYSFIYTGERYESQENILLKYIRSWYTSDMSASKRFTWSKTPIRITAEINNLFNQQYEVVRCYAMPGTSLKFILNITL